jgi:hypothetical protein
LIAMPPSVHWSGQPGPVPPSAHGSGQLGPVPPSAHGLAPMISKLRGAQPHASAAIAAVVAADM